MAWAAKYIFSRNSPGIIEDIGEISGRFGPIATIVIKSIVDQYQGRPADAFDEIEEYIAYMTFRSLEDE